MMPAQISQIRIIMDNAANSTSAEQIGGYLRACAAALPTEGNPAGQSATLWGAQSARVSAAGGL
jgi:hypothetical protein